MPSGGLDAFLTEVHRDIAFWGCLSIVTSSLLLLSYSCLKHVRRTPGWLFLYSTMCDMYVAGGFVVLSLASANANDSDPSANMEHLVCGEYSLLLLTVLGFDMAANAWRLFMYVDLIVVYHNPFRPNTARPLYHLLVAALVFSWLLAISSSDVLCSSDDGPPDGGQGPERSVNVPTLTWGLVYGPFLLFVLLGGSLYLAVKALLARDSDTKKSISRLARQRVMQHCFFYLMMYGILLGTLAAGYASYQFLSTPFPHPQRTFFAHVTAALTSGRPVFGFVGWTVINDVGPLAWFIRCCRRTRSGAVAASSGEPRAWVSWELPS